MQYVYRLSLCVVALVLVSACAQPQQPGATTDEETVAVQRGSLRVTVSGSGTVQPAQSADLAFSTTGTISDVLVVEGETVQQDQELARLDTQTLETQVEVARAQVDAAQAQIDRINEARNDEDGNNAQPGAAVDTSEASQRQAQAQLRQAQAQLEAAELNLEHATLRAPFGGTVTAVNIAPGDSATAVGANSGAPLTIADTSRYFVEANIGETDVARVKTGQTAEITVDALDSEPISGTVSYIAPAATSVQNIPTYLVRLDLPQNVEGLRIGMSASVEINQEQRDDVLLVPNSAIRIEGNRRFVRLKRDETFDDIQIQTGLSNDVQTEVVSGLN